MHIIDAIGVVMIILTLLSLIFPLMFALESFKNKSYQFGAVLAIFTVALLGLYGRLFMKSIDYLQTPKSINK